MEPQIKFYWEHVPEPILHIDVIHRDGTVTSIELGPEHVATLEKLLAQK